MKTIYLDQAATTYPKCEEVYREMDRVNRTLAVNAGRGSYTLAKEATKLIDETRQKLLSLINAQQVAEVVITASATIALNEIIGGIAWEQGDIVYVSPYEHNAVARPLEYMRQRYGIEIRQLPLEENSQKIDVQRTGYLFGRERPKAVFVTHVSNVTGYILPIEEICKMAKETDAITVVDASQSLGLLDIDLTKVQADFLAFAGHKNLYGPFGCGGMYIRNGVDLNIYLAGGTGSDSLNLAMPKRRPGRYEPASPNIIAIAGLNKALDTRDIEMFGHEKELSNYLIQSLEQIDGVRLYLPPQEEHIGIVAFNIEGYQASDVGMILDEDYQIAVRTGYHCAPFVHEHLKDRAYAGVVRASIGRATTKEEIDRLVEAVRELREM